MKNHATCDSPDNNLAVAKENGGIVNLFVMSILILIIKINFSFCRRINMNHNFAKGLLRRFESSMWNDTRPLETKSPTCLYHRFHVKNNILSFFYLWPNNHIDDGPSKSHFSLIVFLLLCLDLLENNLIMTSYHTSNWNCFL